MDRLELLSSVLQTARASSAGEGPHGPPITGPRLGPGCGKHHEYLAETTSTNHQAMPGRHAEGLALPHARHAPHGPARAKAGKIFHRWLLRAKGQQYCPGVALVGHAHQHARQTPPRKTFSLHRTGLQPTGHACRPGCGYHHSQQHCPGDVPVGLAHQHARQAPHRPPTIRPRLLIGLRYKARKGARGKYLAIRRIDS